MDAFARVIAPFEEGLYVGAGSGCVQARTIFHSSVPERSALAPSFGFAGDCLFLGRCLLFCGCLFLCWFFCCFFLGYFFRGRLSSRLGCLLLRRRLRLGG